MTHDELLARIKRYGDWAEVAFDTSPTDALRAVVELHKPKGAEPMWCGECASFDNAPCPYPCPTIQAIEEQLK